MGVDAEEIKNNKDLKDLIKEISASPDGKHMLSIIRNSFYGAYVPPTMEAREIPDTDIFGLYTGQKKFDLLLVPEQSNVQDFKDMMETVQMKRLKAKTLKIELKKEKK